MQAQQSAQEGYIRRALDAQQGGSAAQELARLADLRDQGTISESEFQTLKATTIA
jgi:hypothetical protein